MVQKSEASPWLLVPPMSAEARRIYEARTSTHQEVMGAHRGRSIGRSSATDASWPRWISASPPRPGDVADGLKQERTRLAVQSQSQGAELEARRAEYQDLPRTPLEFMPVKIEVAVTEIGVRAEGENWRWPTFLGKKRQTWSLRPWATRRPVCCRSPRRPGI